MISTHVWEDGLISANLLPTPYASLLLRTLCALASNWSVLLRWAEFVAFASRDCFPKTVMSFLCGRRAGGFYGILRDLWMPIIVFKWVKRLQKCTLYHFWPWCYWIYPSQSYYKYPYILFECVKIFWLDFWFLISLSTIFDVFQHALDPNIPW